MPVLDRLLYRSEHNQGYADHNEDSHAYQLPACDQIAKGLEPHHGSVGKARPCRESDEAAIGGRVAGCHQQENAERYIKAHHHRHRGLVSPA
jgi:hypothetical protein